MKKRALITGITGQTGSYLAELLLGKGYEVFGLKRRTSNISTGRIQHLLGKIHLIDGDLTDSSSLLEAIRTASPDEVYNLGAQSFVKASFGQPESTGDITGLGVTRLLETITKLAPKARFYQASSSELFGSAKPPQSEKTPFHPRSPYGVAKLYGYWITVNYRERDPGIFACNGVLFNHETITSCMPVIYKIGNGPIDIAPIGDVVRFKTLRNGMLVDESKQEYQSGKVETCLYVWDSNGWTKVKYASGYPHNGDKNPRIINARNAVYVATGNHVAIMSENEEKATEDIKIGDRVNLVSLPSVDSNPDLSISEEESELLGLLCGDGYMKSDGPRFINKSDVLRDHVETIWKKIGGERVYYYPSKSGYTGEIV